MDTGAGSQIALESPLDLQALVNEPPPLVGREAELDRAMDALGAQTPALVLVVGEAGMGKSAFLRELDRRATAQGWSVARSREDGELTVTPSTTPPEFDRRLRKVLGLARPEPGAFEVAGLAQQLKCRSPVLLLIDGYRPSATFDRAFTLALLHALSDSQDRVAIVVAEDGHSVEGLETLSSETIHFGPLEADQIRRHFEGLRSQVSPPLGDEELDEYARAAAATPELIGSFVRLLSLERSVAP